MKCQLFVIFLLYFQRVSSVDPLESLIRNGWLMIRDYGEKVISNIAIPRTSDLPESSFQLDPEKKKALDTFSQMISICPQGFPIVELKGLWHVTHISRRILHTTFSDIDEAIDKLSSGKSISSRKSLFSLFQADPVMRCFQVTVLDDSASSSFEFSYFSTGTQRKSIIGTLARPSPSQLTFQFASIIDIPFRTVHSTSNALILSQTDTIPAPCESYLFRRQFEFQPYCGTEYMWKYRQLKEEF